MFDIGSSELLLIIVVAIVVIGPKDLPRALYKVGQVVGKAKGMARHFRTGIDAMIREAELEELQKQWAAENERIMAQTLPDLGGRMTSLVDESATAGELPPPAAAAASSEAVADGSPVEPTLPLDAPHGEVPKGSSAA
ncbi:Sec-independent protein translocase protein TatB [Sphingobium nicotianae]|uniref:Sec-independent protein translocase protein TatB n=1 Tax=Sphingobium nicotianae TaxID=2782607 RepID=A0A9X1DDP2_9SPHN|nr:Sec-independent protein translocase protein TatB [Sphingobium nicotianae]MBT2188004.1 Sec-independent protein translocase protein TatB [Sphingobium nicotianae]